MHPHEPGAYRGGHAAAGGFSTICHSKPGVEALTWWDFADPSFLPHGGLLDERLTPKEGYRRLKALVEGWK